MSCARSFSWFFGKGRNALLYDISITEIAFAPKTWEDYEAACAQIPHMSYPYYVVDACRK